MPAPHADSTEPSAAADAYAVEPRPNPWQMLVQEHTARRWVLARRVGYLEGSIKSAIAALEAGADRGVVAKALRARLDDTRSW